MLEVPLALASSRHLNNSRIIFMQKKTPIFFYRRTHPVNAAVSGLGVAGDGSGMSNLKTMEQLEDQAIRSYDDTEFGVLGKDDALLAEWSPLTRVDPIVAPVFVYQGVRDPVTPQYEADQIVAALRRRCVPVEYTANASAIHTGIRRLRKKKKEILRHGRACAAL